MRYTLTTPRWQMRAGRGLVALSGLAVSAALLGVVGGSPAGATTSGPHTIRATVHFASGKSLLNKNSKATLREFFAQVPSESTRVHATVTGWVQKTKNTSNDRSLSKARASRVAKFLRALGVDGAIVTHGRGVKNASAKARQATAVITYTMPYDITSSAGDNGSISPSTTVEAGGSATFTITAKSCFKIGDVLVDGKSVGPVASYTFTGVEADHEISASFVPADFVITSSAGANGAVSPAGATTVKGTAEQNYTFTPNAGYHVSDVLVDSKSVGASTSYKFTNVCGPHSIAVSFEMDPVTYSTPSPRPTPTPTPTPTPSPTHSCYDGQGQDKCNGKGSEGHSKDGVNNGKGNGGQGNNGQGNDSRTATPHGASSPDGDL